MITNIFTHIIDKALIIIWPVLNKVGLFISYAGRGQSPKNHPLKWTISTANVAMIRYNSILEFLGGRLVFLSFNMIA
jgi:hypothetical protein